MKSIIKRTGSIYAIAALMLLATGCKKYLSIPLPVDQVAGEGAYANDNAVSAVLSNVFGSVTVSANFGGNTGIGLRTGLYADELQNASSNLEAGAFYTNLVQSSNTGTHWTSVYSNLYATNLAIEGIRKASGLLYKNQWLGEALFLRALQHFYLTNLYGKVPVVTTSNYNTNNTSARNEEADVYKQIIADLEEAQDSLGAAYRTGDGVTTLTDRARPNKYAATALLARVYLYTKDWAKAETEADNVISQTATYQLVPPDQVFLKGSKEAIWGLAPPAGTNFVKDAAAYIITAGKTPQESSVLVSLNPSLLAAFEAGDTRRTNWIGESNAPAVGSIPATTYYFANKYKTKTTVTVPVEYLMVLRLAEQYLIRAEARARQNKLTGAKSAKEDLDAVRTRAGLPGTTAIASADNMVDAIIKERRIELFTETGHRLFDLRRTAKLDAVMTIAAPLKGGTWNSLKQWWPIPAADIVVNPNLIQTPGYQ